MTKLEELKSALDASDATINAAADAYYAADAAWDAADDAARAARDAYYAELKKTQEENTND